MTVFAFNPDLDIEALSRSWEPGDRQHIPDILTRETAERLEAALIGEREWRRSVTTATGAFHALLKDDEPQSEIHRQWLSQAAVDGTERAMQYVYDSRVLGSGNAPLPPRGDLLDDFEAWLNQEPQLDVLRGVTGAVKASRVFCQASRFLPGHVLTEHSDLGADQRHFAYVLNLSRDWNPDWGGLLVFYDEAGHVSRGFTPGFNSLNLFRTPQSHAVTQVAAFAQRPRLAISGWLMG